MVGLNIPCINFLYNNGEYDRKKQYDRLIPLLQDIGPQIFGWQMLKKECYKSNCDLYVQLLQFLKLCCKNYKLDCTNDTQNYIASLHDSFIGESQSPVNYQELYDSEDVQTRLLRQIYAKQCEQVEVQKMTNKLLKREDSDTPQIPTKRTIPVKKPAPMKLQNDWQDDDQQEEQVVPKRKIQVQEDIFKKPEQV